MNLNTTLNFLIGFASFLLSAFTIFALAGFLSFHALDAKATEGGKSCVLLHSLYCDEIFRQSPVECDSSLCLHSSAFSYETTAIERKITGFTTINLNQCCFVRKLVSLTSKEASMWG